MSEREKWRRALLKKIWEVDELPDLEVFKGRRLGFELVAVADILPKFNGTQSL